MRTYGGRWVAEAEIGRGGMGTVYRARDRKTGAAVALKVFDDPSGGRSEREARAAALISHPNVVRLVGEGSEDGARFLVFELMTGGSLADRVAKGPLPWREAVAIVAAVARGLGAVHAAGFAHRDVNPRNVLFDERGTPKLSDLGLVRRVPPGFDSRSLTKTGDVLGTPEFLSPEQADGQKDIETRTDLYGLGATLYFALTGKPPFEGETFALYLAHMTRAPAPPEKLAPGIPRAVSALVLRLLAKTPDRRGADAVTVARELEALLSARRRVALVLLVAIVAALGIIIVGRRREPIVVPPPPAPAPRVATPVGKRHTGKVFSVAFSPDGRLVASGGADGRVVVADLEGHVVKEQASEQGAVRSVSFSKDGAWLVCAEDGGWVHRLGLRTAAWQRVAYHGGGAMAALFRTPAEVVSGGKDRFIKLSAVGRESSIRNIVDERGWIRSIALAPDGQALYYANSEGELAAWELDKSNATLVRANDWVLRVAVGADGIVAAGCLDGRVNLLRDGYDAPRSKVIWRAGEVTGVAVGPDWILSASRNELMLSPRPDGPGHALPLYPAPVTAVALGPDGKSFVVGLDDGTVTPDRIP